MIEAIPEKAIYDIRILSYHCRELQVDEVLDDGKFSPISASQEGLLDILKPLDLLEQR